VACSGCPCTCMFCLYNSLASCAMPAVVLCTIHDLNGNCSGMDGLVVTLTPDSVSNSLQGFDDTCASAAYKLRVRVYCQHTLTYCALNLHTTEKLEWTLIDCSSGLPACIGDFNVALTFTGCDPLAASGTSVVAGPGVGCGLPFCDLFAAPINLGFTLSQLWP
jgi:hypothetical protein